MLTSRMRGAFPGAEITAMDISREMLEIAVSKPELAHVRFLAQDLRDPWPAKRWDAIVASLCLHHLAPEERAATAKRVVDASPFGKQAGGFGARFHAENVPFLSADFSRGGDPHRSRS